MWRRLKSWCAADLAVQHLYHLDDRLLADMGLQREDLRDRVMGRGQNPGSPEEDAAGLQKLSFKSTCRC